MKTSVAFATSSPTKIVADEILQRAQPHGTFKVFFNSIYDTGR